jgi:hypothetical protein
MFDSCHHGDMVGRFNVRPGDGDADWVVWDNAVNGNRGTQVDLFDLLAEDGDPDGCSPTARLRCRRHLSSLTCRWA